MKKILLSLVSLFVIGMLYADVEVYEGSDIFPKVTTVAPDYTTSSDTWKYSGFVIDTQTLVSGGTVWNNVDASGTDQFLSQTSTWPPCAVVAFATFTEIAGDATNWKASQTVSLNGLVTGLNYWGDTVTCGVLITTNVNTYSTINYFGQYATTEAFKQVTRISVLPSGTIGVGGGDNVARTIQLYFGKQGSLIAPQRSVKHKYIKGEFFNRNYLISVGTFSKVRSYTDGFTIANSTSNGYGRYSTNNGAELWAYPEDLNNSATLETILKY